MHKDELKALAEKVARLSLLLTRDREDLPAAYLKDAGLREAYQAYFLLPNMAKIKAPLAELALHPAKALEKERLRVFDLGCGPGTASLGVLDFFSARERPPRLEITAVDQVAENLKTAEELFSSLRVSRGLKATMKTVCSDIADLSRLEAGPFDIIILSNVLNELFARQGRKIEKRFALMEEIMTRFLAHDGSLIIIEPALRESSRELLEVRDRMLDEGFPVYAPCFYAGKCPALANPKDWCHEDVPWDPPAVIRELDRLTGLRKDSLKFSWLLFRKDGRPVTDFATDDFFRVVSEPLVSKGKVEFYLCSAKGRRLVMRLDKDGTPDNEAFGAMMRGDVVRFEGLLDDGKRYKVRKDTRVIIRSARKEHGTVGR
jgi:ribosomal protein RSM22 (predicted rRNA methylase)